MQNDKTAHRCILTKVSQARVSSRGGHPNGHCEFITCEMGLPLLGLKSKKFNKDKDVMRKGIVINIERFAVHDGPGIRTVVFMKGCPLKCLWCSTVSSQNMSPELEYYANQCRKCGKCLDVCPTKAIRRSLEDNIITDHRLCTICDKCVEVCFAAARKITGVEMTVSQVLEEVEKDTLFYKNSGGGVTLSGGEASMQPEFSLEILRLCQENGIHTCLETCGYVKWNVLERLLKHLDIVYVDIKHMSPVEHKKLTGRTNQMILKNIRRSVAEYPCKPIVIRIPIIPGLNDSEENITNTAKFVAQLQGEHRIELLPYHKLGIIKYGALSKCYALCDLESPSMAHLSALEGLVKSYGVQVQIGG